MDSKPRENARPREDAKPRERRLADVVREMRTAEADRLDTMDREGEAARARLALLVEELDEVFEEAGGEEAGFDFQIGPGPNPRLWIDAATHVAIARDGRTFRILRDSRGGRTVLGETNDLDDAADHVTRYIATRSLERERLVDEPTAASGRPLSRGLADTTDTRPFADSAAAATRTREVAPKRPSRTGRMARALIWFILGMLVGGALAFLAYGEQLGFANPVPANLRQIYEPYVPPAPGGVAVPDPIEEAPIEGGATDGAVVPVEDAEITDSDTVDPDAVRVAPDDDAATATTDAPADPDFETVPTDTPVQN